MSFIFKYKISRALLFALLLIPPLQAFAGTTSYTYDELNRLEFVNYDNGTVIEYSYDEIGNLQGMASPQYSLNVLKAGEGNGTIHVSDPGTTQCGDDCYIYPSSTVVTLSYTEGEYSLFSSWSEPTCGSNPSCNVTIAGAESVTATFTSTCIELPVRIEGSPPTYYNSIQAAYNAAVDGDIIESKTFYFVEDVYLNQDISVTFQGGYNCEFSSIGGDTVLIGNMSVDAGSASMSNFTIGQLYQSLNCSDTRPRIAREPLVFYNTIQGAYGAAIDGDVIQSKAIELTESVDFNRSVSVSLEGGYSCDFLNVVGQTVLSGDVSVNDGNVVIEKFIVQ